MDKTEKMTINITDGARATPMFLELRPGSRTFKYYTETRRSADPEKLLRHLEKITDDLKCKGIGENRQDGFIYEKSISADDIQYLSETTDYAIGELTRCTKDILREKIVSTYKNYVERLTKAFLDVSGINPNDIRTNNENEK